MNARTPPFAPFPPWRWEIPARLNIGVACTDAHLGTAAADRPAMIVEDDALGTSAITYRELAQRTSRFAQLLRDLGIPRGDRVLIRLPNSLDYPTAFLGAMKRGAVSVPTSTLLTAEEVEYLAHDSGAHAIVIDKAAWRAMGPKLAGKESLRYALLSGAGEVTSVPGIDSIDLGPALDAIDAWEPAEDTAVDDPAYLVYTSGTTGDPKGVMLTHANLVTNVLGAAQVFPQVRSEWTALSFLPLCHSFERTAGHNFMIHAGVTIAYAESVEKVPENILEVRPHIMCSVPRLYEKMYARVNEKVAKDGALRQAIFRWATGVGQQAFAARIERRAPSAWLRLRLALADRLVFSKIKERMGGRLQLFVAGGAPLAREIAEFFGAAGILICEGSGLTETSPVITCNRPERMKPGAVGLPLPGIEVKIAPDGEVLSRGPHIMKGYFGRPEATREAIDEDGFFHTGDLGRIDDDGFLVITDRKKDIIVTSGGKNIAPQPIENKLKTNRFISEVVMVGNRRNFPAALVVPNYEALAAWAGARGISGTREELVRRQEVVAWYQELVASMTGDLAQFEKIKKIALLPRELTQEAGEITPTLKVKRRVVEERYKALIDDLYRGAA